MLKHSNTSKITTIVAILMAVLLISTAVTPIVYAGGGNIGPNSDNENGYIVKLKKGKARVLIDKAVSELKHIPYTDGLFTADSLEDIKDAVDAGLVEYIERDDEISLLDLPEPLTSDPMIINQWYIDALEIADAWNKGLDGNGVTVAVIDSGVNGAHEDLEGVSISGYNFLNHNTAAYNIDNTGHGTFVSGVIAAVRNNGKGLAGLTDKVNLLELRCFDSSTTKTSNVVSAIAYAIEQKADVINMSFGGSKQSLAESLKEQIEKAAEQGIIMVGAAGNGENGDTASLNYPAAFDCVVGVGMTDKNGIVGSSSQKNSSVYVVAPGIAIPGLGNTAPDAYVSSGTGTSYAAPIVSSLAAMVKQTNKAINVEGFKKLLRDCAVDDPSLNGYDTSYGYGIVNARLMAEALTKDYKIVYNCNGGILNGTEGIDYPVEFKLNRREEIYLPIPVKQGFIFEGWYDNEELTGDSISKVPDGCAGDVEYYAKWYSEPVSDPVIDPSEVSFDKNLSNDDVFVRINLYDNSLVSVTNDVYALEEGVDYSVDLEQLLDGSKDAVVTIKEDYLKGLSLGNHKLTFLFKNDKSDADLMGYIEFYISAATYTETFISDGVIYSQVSDVIPGTSVIMPDVPQKSGYIFKGWSTQADGSGADFTASTKVNDNITVYAKWELKSPDVIYNNGTGTGDNTGNSTGISTGGSTGNSTVISTGDKATDVGDNKDNDTEVNVGIDAGNTGSDEDSTEIDAGNTGSDADNTGIDEDNEATEEEGNTGTGIGSDINGDEISDTHDMTEDTEWSNPFSDVDKKDWYYDAVAFALRKGIFSGMSKNKFVPDAVMTRGMLVTVLYRMAGEPQVNANKHFIDVAKGSWYENAVNWAAANKIISGVGGGMFMPDAPVTREQIAVILYNYNVKINKNDTATASQSVLDKFLDKGNVSKWAVEAMSWAVAAKIVNGKSGSILDAASNATRAEVAAILQRFIKGKL